MYTEHPVFDVPNGGAKLWRYVDFTKYVSMLDTRDLYFTRADLLGDPFEGSYSYKNVRLRAEVYANAIPAEHLARLSAATKAFVRHTFISSWHLSDYESAAMWKLYLRDHGVAIQTTFESLTASLTSEQSVFVGKVRYIDFLTEWMPEGNSLWPFVHKRRSFEHEREVRAVIQQFPIRDGMLDTEAELGSGMRLPVDLDTLIETVYVAPEGPRWFLDLVRSVTARFGIRAAVRSSDLATDPVY